MLRSGSRLDGSNVSTCLPSDIEFTNFFCFFLILSGQMIISQFLNCLFRFYMSEKSTPCWCEDCTLALSQAKEALHSPLPAPLAEEPKAPIKLDTGLYLSGISAARHEPT